MWIGATNLNYDIEDNALLIILASQQDAHQL